MMMLRLGSLIKYHKVSKSMLAHLIEHLIGEKHDFYEYIELYHEATDPTAKMKFKEIASQEMKHYKDVMDLVFRPIPTHEWSPLEVAFKDEACK